MTPGFGLIIPAAGRRPKSDSEHSSKREQQLQEKGEKKKSHTAEVRCPAQA